MNIDIFNLNCAQPLVWVVLALIALIGIPNVFFYRELSTGYYLEERKHLKVFNWILSVAVVALWVVIIAANHTTVWHDILNFAFVMGFSFVFAAAAVVAFTTVIAIILVVLLLLYYLILGIIELFRRKPHSESEDDFE